MRSAGIIKRLNGLKDEIEMSELICHEEQIKFKMLIKLRENQKQDSLIQKREDYIQNSLDTIHLIVENSTQLEGQLIQQTTCQREHNERLNKQLSECCSKSNAENMELGEMRNLIEILSSTDENLEVVKGELREKEEMIEDMKMENIEREREEEIYKMEWISNTNELLGELQKSTGLFKTHLETNNAITLQEQNVAFITATYPAEEATIHSDIKTLEENIASKREILENYKKYSEPGIPIDIEISNEEEEESFQGEKDYTMADYFCKSSEDVYERLQKIIKLLELTDSLQELNVKGIVEYSEIEKTVEQMRQLIEYIKNDDDQIKITEEYASSLLWALQLLVKKWEEDDRIEKFSKELGEIKLQADTNSHRFPTFGIRELEVREMGEMREVGEMGEIVGVGERMKNKEDSQEFVSRVRKSSFSKRIAAFVKRTSDE